MATTHVQQQMRLGWETSVQRFNFKSTVSATFITDFRLHESLWKTVALMHGESILWHSELQQYFKVISCQMNTFYGNFPPHCLTIGWTFLISGVLERDCFQIKAATSRACLICWNKASLVGGMESRDIKLWENMSFLASFTNSALQFLLYMSTVQRSRCRVWSESSVKMFRSWVMAISVSVTSG